MCIFHLAFASDFQCQMANAQCSMLNAQWEMGNEVLKFFPVNSTAVAAGLKSSKWRGHPFSRSYGANVPSSLERFLSRALVYSTHPPVSVYGTGNWGNDWRLFSAHCPVMRFGETPKLSIRLPNHLSLCVPSSLNPSRCRNI